MPKQVWLSEDGKQWATQADASYWELISREVEKIIGPRPQFQGGMGLLYIEACNRRDTQFELIHDLIRRGFTIKLPEVPHE